MSAASDKVSVLHIDQLDLVFSPKPWAFAEKWRAAIDTWFTARQRENPMLWNGRVLLLHEQVLAKGIFRGRYLETDFASFTAWRQWGRPPAGISDCFAAAALLAADGAFLLGVMGPHTVNAGRTYFPCGTPDPKDIYGTRVDLDLSMQRELKEETGLDIAEFTPEPGWTSIFDGSLIAHIKVLRSNDDARTLRARIYGHLARERQPELADIRIVRRPEDFDMAMPRFVTTFLTHRFSAR